MAWLINPVQLDRFRKNQKNIIILDATWVTPDDERDMRVEFEDKHVAGARYFDINAFADSDSALPNMLTRDEKLIADKLGELGISSDMKVVFYDKSKMRTSCRAVWMMKMFGHNSNLLYVLDGGLDAWEQYGGKMETGAPKPAATKTYKVDYQTQMVRTLDQMKTNVKDPQEQVIDMRNPVRYAGGKESRPGMRAGHIPGSFCFPFSTMFDGSKWKSVDQIRKQLTGIGVEVEQPIITSCGSGTTAPILNFALDLMGMPETAMYDGSWTEWGAEKLYAGEPSLDERPVQTSLE